MTGKQSKTFVLGIVHQLQNCFAVTLNIYEMAGFPLAILRTYKYRLYPTRRQERKLNETLWLCSIVYNRCLVERRDAWQQGRANVSFYEQKRQLPLWKQQEPKLASVYAHVLADAVRRLDHAFEGFFRRVKAGEKPGYPRFKSARRYESFTYPDLGFTLLKNGKLKLGKIGAIKVKVHRPIAGKPKTLTICRQADGWYACFACEGATRAEPKNGKAVGIDLGLENFATSSDGEVFPSAKHLRKAERGLKRLQRLVSRRKRGSNRRKKAVQLLAKAHLRVANQRKDTAHKVARSLVNRYGLIAVEDLQITNMLRNHHLAKSISDAGWGIFVNILTSKAAGAGRGVIKVDPRYTSQICSDCGQIVRKPLSQRWHSCECGCELHRDVNAAINILRRAIS